jgi:hypothetical protein
MGRKTLTTVIVFAGLAVVAWGLSEGLPTISHLVPMALAQTEPPAPPAEQPDVTERGLPGQAIPSKPGTQPSMQKVPILPKLQASPPPTAQPQPKQPASPETSPDEAARAALQSLAASTQAVQQPRPGIRELLDILRALPGGAQVIEDAKRRGARLSSNSPQPRANWYAWLDPFEPPAAEAADGFAVTLSPGHLSEPSREGGHYLSLVGMSISGLHNYETPGSFHLYNSRHASGSQIMKPYAKVHVSVPRDGWYLINFQMFFWNGLATLKRFVPPDQYPVIQTFDYRTRPRGQFSFPALLELAAGQHDFYLAIEAGSASFFEASVTLL